jgi:hypothetical protein
MLARGDQHMTLENGPGIQEGDHDVVVEHDVRRDSTGGDVAEDAVADGTSFLLAGKRSCTDDSLRGWR